MPNLVYILLGSNQGNTKQNLLLANNLIEKNIGVITIISSLYETAAWGNTQQSAFLNQVILVRTKLLPKELLHQLLAIETQMGRIRTTKWEPRIIDLDILFYDNEVIEEVDLVIPHPFIQQRRFTLVPLLEIASNFMHPVLHKTMEELLAMCEDNLNVEKITTK
jgi:2-amino-4-hydroxy-6-hydroxymethyldihydropteridine diphosphokinase